MTLLIQSFTNETAWLRKAGLIETIGVVDIFTLLSHSWQCLGFIRLLRYSAQLENFNSLVSKYDNATSYDVKKFSEVRLLGVPSPVGVTNLLFRSTRWC